MNPQNLVLFLLLAIINSRPAFAQPDKLRFEHITTAQGLADNTALSTMEDSKGFIWISTFNGLCKYDGYNFITYQFDPDDNSSIGGNVITRVLEDRDGTIWVVVRGSGIYLFDRSTEKFTRFKPANDTIPLSISFSWGLNEDKEGKIWIGNDSDGQLFRYDKQTGAISTQEYTTKNFAKPDFNSYSREVRCIYRDRSGNLWVGSSEGLYRLNLTPGEFGKQTKVSFTAYHHDPKNPKTLASHFFAYNGICEDKEGMIWVGGKGLSQLNPKTGECKRYIPDPANPQSISSDDITGIGEDKKGNLWISTNNGLNKLNKERTIFTRYFHDDDDPTSLSHNNIWSLFLDKQDILWLNFVGAGINKLDLNQNPMALYQHQPSNANSLSNNNVSAICEDRSGIVWLGTLGGGLNAWDRRTNKFIHYRDDPSVINSLGSDFVSAIIEDKEGNLWIGGGKNRIAILSKLDKKSGIFKHYFFKYPYRNSYDNPVLTLYEDKEGMIWMGTSDGAIRFNRKTETWVHYPFDPNNKNGLSDYWVNSVCEDKRGNFWIGHNSHALVKFNPNTKIFSHYFHNPNDSNSITSSIVKSIFKDSKSNLWFATRHGGLCRLNEENETFTAFTKKDGLPSNTIYSILEDNDSNLWLTTNKGLCRFNPSTHSFTTFDADDGLQGNQFEIRPENTGGCFKGQDGTLYFGGPNGLNVFHPHNLTVNTIAPPVAITRFSLFDKPRPGKNETDQIVLKHNENFFSFEFAALNFINTSKNQYAYQLAGIDKDWVYSGTRRFTSYTDIAPGKYKFRVKAANKDGVWNEKGASINIIILPPWWKTWWFYGLCLLAAASLIYILFQYRLQQKLRVLQIRNRLHRDLHDDVGATLSSVKAYSEILKDNPDNPLIAELIRDNSTEMIERLEVIAWATNPQHDNFKSLKNTLAKFAAPLCHSRNIQCNIENNGINEEMMMSGEVRQNIFLVFKEAVNNMIKYAEATACAIHLFIRNNQFVMQITDNGKGSDGTVKGSGAGWKNMQKRAESLNGKLVIESISGKGTVITMSLPYPFKIPNSWEVKRNSY